MLHTILQLIGQVLYEVRPALVNVHDEDGQSRAQ
jgi:hypothetical protein